MRATAVALTMIVILLFSSFCAEAHSVKKMQKDKEKSEKIQIAKKLGDEAQKAFISVSRHLTTVKNRIKYGDSTCAASYSQLAQELTDSLEICRFNLDAAKEKLAQLQGNLKAKKIRAGKLGSSLSFASAPVISMPVRPSGRVCINCSGSWSPKR